MKNLKKLLSVILTVCMTLSLLPMTALADGINQPDTYLVTNENNEIVNTYSTLANAVAHANSGWTILVVNSLAYNPIPEENQPVVIENGKSLTLNLCEQTLNLLSGSGPALTVSGGGSLTVINNGTLNVTATGGDPALTVNGGTLTLDTSATSAPKIHVKGVNIGLSVVDGGKATVTSVEASGDNCTGVQAAVDANAAVVVKGDVTVSGENSYGVAVSGLLNSVTVEGGISATGISCRGASVSSGAGANTLTVKQNVTVSGTGSTGVSLSGGTLTVNGSVSASGDNCTGTIAYNGSLLVNGNVTATGTSSVGAVLPAGGAYITITINGVLSASTYIMANDSPMTISGGADGTGADIGCRIYSGSGGSGPQIVKVKMPVRNTDTEVYYLTLSDALEEAEDGDTITLLRDITESASNMKNTKTNLTLTIDGGGHTVTAPESANESTALTLINTGTVILKDLTLQGGASTGSQGVSTGLKTGGTLDIRRIGTVIAKGGAAVNSYGLNHNSDGTVDVTKVDGISGTALGIGVSNGGHGTVNVETAQGAQGGQSSGVYNERDGTVNVAAASGLCGVANATGTVNVTTATGGSYGVYNIGTGTINAATIAATAQDGIAVQNDSGTVNVKTISSGVFTTTANLNVATVTLNAGTGADCVLDSITVAATGETAVGTLPSVYKNNTYNNTWYTDSAKTTSFSSTTVTGVATLYSSFYTAPAKIRTTAISGVTAPVRGAAPVTSLAETSEYTATIAWSPAVSGTFAASTVYTATITLTPKTGYTATGVAANFFTVSGATATNSADSGIITAVFPATASASSNDSSPSSGTTTITPTTTVSGTTATTTVTPTVSGGAATGTVTTDQMSDALKKAQAAAGAGGTPNVAIQVSGAAGARSIATTIPHASMQALVSGGVGSLTVSGPAGSVSFDAAALKAIAAANGDVTVTIAKTDSSTLSDAARTLVGSHPVFTLSVTGGGSAITQFGSNVTVSVPYTPASGEDTNAIVIYYIAADGTPTLVQDAHYDAAMGTVSFTTTHFSTYAVAYNKVNFTDVLSGTWYHDAVTFLAARGVTSGTTASTFSPDATLTRGQFITMLLRAYGVAALTDPTDNFADAGNTYYTCYLAAAKKLGITSGVGGNMFAPEQAITRQEMFALLYNALKVLDKLPSGAPGKTLASFTDSGNIASWATDAMTALVRAGTVTGSGGKLDPTGGSTRAQMAQVLYNLLAQ